MKRGDLPIAVSHLSFKIAHTAAERAVLFLCCGQLGSQIGARFLRRFGGIATNVIPSVPSVSLRTNGARIIARARNGTILLPARTACQSGQASYEDGGLECLHDDLPPS